MPDESHHDPNHSGGVVLAMPGRGHATTDWEPWLDEHAVARHYGVSTRTIRRWRLTGMPSRAIGGTRRYRLSDCDRWHEVRNSA